MMKRKNFFLSFLASAALAATALTGCAWNEDNPYSIDFIPTIPATGQDIFANMEKVSAPAYISDVTNAHLKDAMERRFTNHVSLDDAQIAVVTPQEIGTYDGKLLELYNRGGLVVILKPDMDEYKAFVEKHNMQYAMPSAEDGEMLLFAFNKDLQYYTVFAKDQAEDVQVTTTGHDDNGNEEAASEYVETPEVTIDVAWYVEQTDLFVKWVNELLAEKARTRGSDGYSADAVLSKTVSSGQFNVWPLSTRGYKDSEKISATAKVSYKISVTPLYVYNNPGAESQHGDYYAIKAELTAHNRDIYKFTRFDRSGILADDYILGFFMEYLTTTFEFGQGKKVKSAVFYENPKPETSQGSVTYSSTQTMGFNMSLNGGVAGGTMQLAGSGAFNASWSEGVSMNVSDLTVRTNFEPTGKVDFDYTVNNIKEGYPHKGESYYSENVNGIFRAGQKAYLPEIAINGVTMTATWIWHDASAADNSTTGSQMRMKVTPKFGSWDWRYHGGDHRRAFKPGTKTVWLNLPVPNRNRFGVLALKNGHTGMQMSHIKIYNQSDKDAATPVAEIPSSYGKGEVARVKLNEGTYCVKFDLMSGTFVLQSLQIENVTIKGALTESASTTEVATNDGK